MLPEDYVLSRDAVEDLLDQMDQSVSDDCGSQENVLSIVKGSEQEAIDDFERLLRAWARKYVRCSWYQTLSWEEVQISG